MRKLLLLWLVVLGVIPYVSAQEEREQQKLTPHKSTDYEENKKKGRVKLWKKQRKWKPPHRQSWTWNKFRQGYRSIGFGINAMNYFGDLTPLQDFYATDIEFTRANFSVLYIKRHRPMYTSRLMFSYGRLKGSDSTANAMHIDNQFRYVRNLHFRNDIFELSYSGIVNLAAHRDLYYNRPDKVLPYLTFGIAILYHEPKALMPEEFGDDWVKLRKYTTEGQGGSWTNPETGKTIEYGKPYSPIQIAIPLGFGFKKRIGQRWDLSFEVNMRFLITDYLDDVSGDFPDPGIFTELYPDDPDKADLARALSDRTRENGRVPVVLSDHIVTPKYYLSPIDGNEYITYLGKYSQAYENIRGNNRDRDSYMVTGIHLSYILPGQVRCPEPFKRRHRNPWHWHRGASR